MWFLCKEGIKLCNILIVIYVQFVEGKHLQTALCSNGHGAPHIGKETAQKGVSPGHPATSLHTNSHDAYHI